MPARKKGSPAAKKGARRPTKKSATKKKAAGPKFATTPKPKGFGRTGSGGSTRTARQSIGKLRSAEAAQKRGKAAPVGGGGGSSNDPNK